jgi:LAS superfamily LD-carboxypeptidase LdcB
MPIWGAVAQAARAALPEPIAAPPPEPAAAPADTFTPIAVETPGGGRIKNKTAPPKDQLVTVTGTAGRKIPLHRLAAAAWQALVAAARRDGLAAPLLLPTSGFRDPAHQARLWKTALARYGSPEAARKWVAPPGSSPHQTGRAIDFYLGGSNGSANVAKLRTLPAYRWMVANAQRFGFYPYPAEPWHWEYNPPAQSAGELGQFELGQFEFGLQSELDQYHQSRQRPTSAGDLAYDTDPAQPFGPKWKGERPPGLPANARLTSRLGAASPHIGRLASATGLGAVFVQTVGHLAMTESGAMFGRPANIFDARATEQRPAGKPLITAWGAFQFNRDAWRGLPGVTRTAFPWDSTALEEITRPIEKYAALYRAVVAAGGSPLDAARGIRLWHRTPAGFQRYLQAGRGGRFAAAWSAVPDSHRQNVDANLRRAGTLNGAAPTPPRPPQPTPPAPLPPGPTPAAAGLRGRIVATALAEWQKWNAGGRRTETDPRMRAILADYWKTGAGVNVRESDLGSTPFQASHPWSAAFISWVMKKAGAGPAFRYSAAHAVYTAAARQNRLTNNGNPFQAFRVSEAAPALGDLVCKSRAGSGATYDNVRAGMKTHCDVVVAVAPGQITVVGGNVENSVSRKTVRTNAAGLLTDPEYFAVIRSGPLAGSPQPAPRPAPTPPRPAPGPSGSTIYAPIDLEIKDGAGNRVKPQTGIFCPPGWRPTGPIDLVIYLHGIRDPRITIDSYWNAARHSHFALREDVASSGKNAVLVAPLLGPRSQNQIGILGRPGGLDKFVGSVLSALAQQARLPAGTQVGNIILACHSGGGLAMRIIALANNKLAARIRECWGYDCTYNRDDFTVWPRWAAQRSSSRLVMFYLPGTKTAAQALKLKQRGVPNVTVAASRARNHNWVPRAHFLEQLKQTPALKSIGR